MKSRQKSIRQKSWRAWWSWKEQASGAGEREELGPGKDLDLVIKSHQGVLSKGSLGGSGADWEWAVG